MAWCSGGGRIGIPLRRARDEEWRACSMISERCACGCDSSGHTVSARMEDRSRARDTSAQVQAGRRGIAPPIPVLHGLASYPGSKLDRSAQRLVLGGGLGRRWPNCTSRVGRCSSAKLHLLATRLTAILDRACSGILQPI